jgi:hypothetical protein
VLGVCTRVMRKRVNFDYRCVRDREPRCKRNRPSGLRGHAYHFLRCEPTEKREKMHECLTSWSMLKRLTVFMKDRYTTHDFVFGRQNRPEDTKFKIARVAFFLNASTIRIDPPSPLHHKTNRPAIQRHEEVRRQLRDFVERWKKSGPNLHKFFAENPRIHEAATQGLVLLQPSSTGRAYLEWMPTPKGPAVSLAQDTALTHFMLLITNPDWELLGGPCLRCDQYYLKRRKGSQKGYCSNQCRSAATALSSQRKRRAQERQEKLAWAEKYIQAWLRTDQTENWKVWISRRARLRHGVTKNWLTQEVNAGRLIDPMLDQNAALHFVSH